MAENESLATRMYEAMAAANASHKKVEKLTEEKEENDDKLKNIEEMLSANLDKIQLSINHCLNKFDETTKSIEYLTNRVEKLESKLRDKQMEDSSQQIPAKYPPKVSLEEMRQLLVAIGIRAVPEVKGIEKRPVVHPSTYAGASQLYSPLQNFGPVYKSDFAPLFNTNEPMVFWTKSRFPSTRKCLPQFYQDPKLATEEAPGRIKGLWKMVTSTKPTMDVKLYDSAEIATYNAGLVSWIILFGGQIYNISHLLEENSPLYLRICNDEKKQKFTEKELESMTINFIGEVVVFQWKPDNSVQEKLDLLTKKIESVEVLLKQKPKEK